MSVWRREDVEEASAFDRSIADAHAVHSSQPYRYERRGLVERDWRRFPGFADVAEEEWSSAKWQRRNTVRNMAALGRVLGDLLDPELRASIERDQRERATMPLAVPPHMLNTMGEHDLWGDPVRRYMLPAFDDRDVEWPSHPVSRRDSLHEAEMFAVEGLIHRYPTKVLVELTATCPQYCGHCTRMDLVGVDVPQVEKHRLVGDRVTRHTAALAYIARVPWIRDVVVSGGDIADVPIAYLERFLSSLFALENIRSVRLATKALIGVPQYFLQDEVLSGIERIAASAREHDVDLAVHVHANHVQSITPRVVAAAHALYDAGVRHIRNQGVLLRGVNDSPEALLDLSFALLDEARIAPYYFYMCDMIPGSEHWRVSLAEAQLLQEAIMGFLPGFATPRIVCDVPGIGKRLVHQARDYDRVRGISTWRKQYATPLDGGESFAEFCYYDPIPTLPEEGREYWRRNALAG